MRLKVISCDVLMREICHLVSQGPHVYDLEFTEKDAHNQSDTLRTLLQEKIDASDEKSYDAILLAFGLCGNASVGLVARKTPIVIPRAHDCATLFLGSKELFKVHFQHNPSQLFSSAGYMERGNTLFHEVLEEEDLSRNPDYQKYVYQYGEENAQYIYDSLHPKASNREKIVYIDVPETRFLGYAELCRTRAKEKGLEFLLLEGSTQILRKLIFGEWDESDFLILNPGEETRGIYDWDVIIGKHQPSQGRQQRPV